MSHPEVRQHLLGLSTAFADDNRVISPDPEVCAAEQFPEHYANLVRRFARCQDAAHVINTRYHGDWEHGGPMTMIAADIRAAGLESLERAWQMIVDGYIAEVSK